jgi:lipoprotein signal peptidase
MNKLSFKKFFKSINAYYVLVMVLLLSIDILTKLLINKYVTGSVTIIPGFCYIDVIYNSGSGYGFLDTAPAYVHVLIRSAALAAMLYYYIAKYHKLTKWYKAALVLLIPGDLGNLIDHFGRWVSPLKGPYGQGVIDWLEFKSNIRIFNYTCNFADVLLTFGAICFILGLLFEEVADHKKDKKMEEEKSAPSSEKEKTKDHPESAEEKKDVSAVAPTLPPDQKEDK